MCAAVQSRCIDNFGEIDNKASTWFTNFSWAHPIVISEPQDWGTRGLRIALLTLVSSGPETRWSRSYRLEVLRSAVEQGWDSRSQHFLPLIYQSNPQPREPSFRTLQKLWQPSPSSEGIQSWVYKHAGTYRETGREVLLLSMSSSWIFAANTLVPDLITAPRRSLKGLPLPQHLLLSGLRLLWCLLHCPWRRDIYIWWCWDELCSHFTGHRFNEEISFLFLALAFNGF